MSHYRMTLMLCLAISLQSTTSTASIRRGLLPTSSNPDSFRWVDVVFAVQRLPGSTPGSPILNGRIDIARDGNDIYRTLVELGDASGDGGFVLAISADVAISLLKPEMFSRRYFSTDLRQCLLQWEAGSEGSFSLMVGSDEVVWTLGDDSIQVSFGADSSVIDFIISHLLQNALMDALFPDTGDTGPAAENADSPSADQSIGSEDEPRDEIDDEAEDDDVDTDDSFDGGDGDSADFD